MTGKVISWLEQILPDIKSTGEPESVMLKFAHEQNLAPALLEKLAQVFNSAKTLNFLDKSANRGEKFHVVDADALVRRYVTAEPAKAAADSFSDWIDRPATKSAALTAPIADRWPVATPAATRVLEEPLVNLLGAKRANAKAELRARSAAQATEANYRQVVFDLGEQADALTTKLAEQIRVTPDFDFAALEADALGLHGDRVKTACAWVSHRLKTRHFTHKRASAPTSGRLVRDSAGLIAGLAQLAATIEQHTFARSLESDYVKAAATALAPQAKDTVATLDPREEEAPASEEKAEAPRAPRLAPKPGAPAPAPERSGGSILDKLQKIPVPQAPIEPGTVLRNLVHEALPTRNTGQQKVDRDYDDLHSQIVMERLLMTDPILAEADPHTVVSLANSIREQAPHVARDINAMRFALREAVQYQALPTHTLKDLVGIEKTRTDVEQNTQDLSKERYAQGMKKEKAK